MGEKMNIIQIEDLVKKYNDTMVLNHVSIEFKKGKIYGLIGRNGSGKTVLLKCICGFITPTQGHIYINGKDIEKCRSNRENLGIIIEHPGFLTHYSGYKNLKMLAMIQNKIDKQQIIDAMKLVDLDPYNKKAVGKYSLGMKQRLGIAQAIMENQQILILDEPMNGLDNSSVDKIRKIILKLKQEGKTIVIASHFKEDIQLLCDEVYQLDNGNIIEHIVC